MGQVVYLDAAREPRARAPSADFIDAAYDALESLPKFRTRPGQRALSRAIFDSLISGTPLAAEAPTGTGKTLAYLVAALAARDARPDTNAVPVVIATATVGLQHQIITGDLPKLVEAKLLGHNDAIIAKGRGRYFCVLSAERIVAAAKEEGQFDFFDSKSNEANETLTTAKELLEQFFAGVWDGDRDHFSGAPPAPPLWARMQASGDTCIGRRCEYFEQCAFFRERARLANAKVVVANQDLVLSDLQMAKGGQQDPLIPAEKYLLVFDEAHNLPDKALEAGAGEVDLEGAQAVLSPLPGFAGKLFRDSDIAKLLNNRELVASDFEPGPALVALVKAAACVRAMDPTEPGDTVVRLGRSEELPPQLARTLGEALERLVTLETNVNRAISALRNSTLPERKPHTAAVFAEVLYLAAFFGTRLREVVANLNLFMAGGRIVRWLDHNVTRAQVHVSPLEGADVLRHLLWEQERAIPVLVSATLKTFGNFERFKVRSGLPRHARTYAADPIFEYAKSELVIANMTHSPSQFERPQFEKEVEEVMPRFIRHHQATLVLFPSKQLMRRTLPSLRQKFGAAVIAQGEMPFPQLVHTHKSRADKGETTVLCGLATLAEGLDLPGHYCVHVVIVTLPFTVPTSPVERELQEQLGPRYFRERALPDALTHLIQMVGRLIRREGDQGRITVLDKRLNTTRWGWDLVKALPPFRRRAERTGDRIV